MVLLLGAVGSISTFVQLEERLIGQALTLLSAGTQQLLDAGDKNKHDS